MEDNKAIKPFVRRTTPLFTCPPSPILLPSIQHPSPVFFPSSRGKKRSFEKAFDINCRLLARDRNAEEVDLSFAGCQCPPAVKANREWQQELLNPKPVCMVEAIPLAATIFWDPNLLLCPRHTLNLAKKLGLKTKNPKADIVKERIGQICSISWPGLFGCMAHVSQRLCKFIFLNT